MAKARKKQPAKKRKTKAKKGSQSSNSVLLIIIILIVGGGIFYGLNKNSDLSETIDSVWQQKSQKSNNEPNTDKPKTHLKNNERPTVTTNTSSKSNTSTKSTSLDGKKEEVKTNEDLPSYDNDNPYYFSSSFDFAWPAYSQNDPIVEHQFYTLKYNEKTEQADWVAYKLTAKNLKNSRYKALDNFRADPDVQSKSATPNDYKGSGYDRGHLAPASDFSWSKQGVDESFYMSNMSPQVPGFNRGIWKTLEGQVSVWAKKNKEIYIVSGPIFKGKSKKIGKTKIAVPDQYYKVVLELQGKDVKGIAFLLNNEKSSSSLASFAMSIDDLEKKTKLDFFPSIPDQLENQIESKFNYSDW